ncbi:MAG TPA: DUF4124 domain-containing protein [Thiobacillus sp.]
MAFASGPTHAELFKWTDGQGKIHYSDQPPSVDTKSIGQATAGQSAITTDAKKSLNEKDQDYLKRKKEAEEAQTKAESEAEKARAQQENCAKARKNLAVLQNTPRVYSTNPAGQRVYMDDAARSNALANSQKAIQDFCK